jgi:hypothetical protein
VHRPEARAGALRLFVPAGRVQLRSPTSLLLFVPVGCAQRRSSTSASAASSTPTCSTSVSCPPPHTFSRGQARRQARRQAPRPPLTRASSRGPFPVVAWPRPQVRAASSLTMVAARPASEAPSSSTTLARGGRHRCWPDIYGETAGTMSSSRTCNRSVVSV